MYKSIKQSINELDKGIMPYGYYIFKSFWKF